MLREQIKTDVLVIGGGIAGLMAAIRAAEMGAKVTMAEKANTLRSGAGATGNDHFMCYIPEFHGSDMQALIAMCQEGQVGSTRTASYFRTWLEKSLDIVKLWDSWGIPMKPTGKWEFTGHGLPGRPFPVLKYAGQNQKIILTKEALKRGVKIINRVMVFDLLKSGGSICGALGIGTREEKIYTFLANAVFLGTGRCVRLYPSATPGWMFNRAESPSNTGDGRAMAFRAGAELANMEIPQTWSGPRYFLRCGKGTWIGVVRTTDGKPVGPYVTQPDRRYGDLIANAVPTLFDDFEKRGKGPVYMDCRGISNEDYQYMLWGLTNEGNTALLNHLKEEGIDLQKHPVEFMTYELTTRGGIKYRETAETSLKGLFAAGDEYFAAIAGAAIYGYIGGENSAKYAKDRKVMEDSAGADIAEKTELAEQASSRKSGASWQEANIALSQLMQDYLGWMRSQVMMEAGLTNLKRLRKKASETLMARNQHELMHCLEVMNLMDVGEVMFNASMARQESRGEFRRPDYPFTNVLLNNKELICRNAENKIITEWNEIK
jgi:succinate dehydrogenase/fumarate reductase flavoprotein subunit